MNYNMNKLNYALPDLLNMLVVTECTLKSSKKNVLSVERVSRSKKKSLGKKKKPTKKLKKKKKEDPKPKSTTDKRKCFYCNVVGHWKRNCPTYQVDLKMAKVVGPSEGMLVFTICMLMLRQVIMSIQ